jgi:hypothetical protein
MSPVRILSPFGRAQENVVAPVRLAPRRPLDGGHLVLVGNGKPKAQELLMLLGDLLVSLEGVAEMSFYGKPDASHPIDPDEAARLAVDATAAITGLGDCGACSACSLHDAVTFETLGVPATVLITEPFQARVAAFSTTLGAPGYHSLVIPHPVSSRDADRLRLMAESIVGAATTQLEGPHV